MRNGAMGLSENYGKTLENPLKTMETAYGKNYGTAYGKNYGKAYGKTTDNYGELRKI